ncbi:unnamed protein product [Prorocentrum cordatum]|uniref:S1-like domain-containing protein n=1 Tax=Prorocentrum cordatum TaxID=2364126 RepID=A0ABN9U5D1_9DINO|nr:unnamed protein product [Polarella glacialis]
MCAAVAAVEAEAAQKLCAQQARRLLGPSRPDRGATARRCADGGPVPALRRAHRRRVWAALGLLAVCTASAAWTAQGGLGDSADASVGLVFTIFAATAPPLRAASAPQGGFAGLRRLARAPTAVARQVSKKEKLRLQREAQKRMAQVEASKAKKEDQNVIELEGEVMLHARNVWKVMLSNGAEVQCTLGGKLRKNNIRVLEGDRVTVEMSPFDLTRGRITFRSIDSNLLKTAKEKADEEKERRKEREKEERRRQAAEEANAGAS